MISNWNGTILPEVQREFEKSPEWQKFEDELLAVGERQIQIALESAAKTTLNPLAGGKQSSTTKTAKNKISPTPLLSKYRSELKRGILIQLTQNPGATDLEVCRGLDADASVELPEGWKVKAGDRLFAEAYRDPKIRHKIEIAISRIRTDLRNQGLLDRS
jgi:hypothetical protein